MGRVAKGTVRLLKAEHPKPGRDKQWHAKWTRDDGSRTEWLPLDPRIEHGPCCVVSDPKCEHRQQAEACAASMAPDVRSAKGEAETVGKWFERFHAAKEAKGLATVGEMRGRARKWILPGIENKPMRDGSVTRADCEAIVARLDRAQAAFLKHGPGDGRLSPSTTANVWGDFAHACDEAVTAKDASLRVLTVNPAKDVRGPEAGDDREGPILYSDELVALLRGVAAEVPGGKRTPDVPLYRRQCYAMAVYTKGRSSELEALTAANVELGPQTITIARQADRKSKGRKDTKQTKTKRVRTVDIEAHLLPLVEWLVKHPQGKRGRLLHMPPPEDRAELLRKDLRTVGVTREALHVERDPLRRPMGFHELRDTGLTHMAVRGDSPIAIQWAGGHTDFKTTQGYIDRGRVEARRIGEPLPPLPPEVLSPTSDGPSGIAPKSPRTISKPPIHAKTSTKLATPMGIEPMLPT